MVHHHNIKLDVDLVVKQSGTGKDIKVAVQKVNEYNKMTKDVLSIKPFMKHEKMELSHLMKKQRQKQKYLKI